MEDDITAKVSNKGQVTIPKPIRDALRISGGEEIMFRLEERRAVLATNKARLKATPATAPVPVMPPPPPRVPWDAARRSLLAARAKPQRPGAPTPGPAVSQITVDLRTEVEAEVDGPQG